jgi:hypothetical protein
VYLDQDEYKKRLEHELESYYRFLARRAFELKGREFWNYHRNELKKLGYPLRKARLIKTLLIELLDFREVTRRMRRGLASRKNQTASHDAQKQDNMDKISTGQLA